MDKITNNIINNIPKKVGFSLKNKIDLPSESENRAALRVLRRAKRAVRRCVIACGLGDSQCQNQINTSTA